MKLAFGFVSLLVGLLPLFNADAQTWQAVQYANGTSPLQRHENSFVEVNGKFYLLGGRGIKSVDIFDPITKIWTAGAQTPIELHHFQAVAYQNKIYVICAMTGPYPAETPVDRVYIYTPQTNTWSDGPTIPINRRRGSSGVVIYNNKFYIVCGIQDGHRSGWVPWLDEFDPATGIWTQLPDAPEARDHFHVGLINGKIYSAGGRRTSQPVFAANTVSNVDVYDIENGTWSTPSQIPTPRGAPAVAVVNDELIVAGGEVDYQGAALNVVETYNPVTNSWSVKPNMNVGRHATQFIYYTGSLYIAAGSTAVGGAGENNTMASASFAPVKVAPVITTQVVLSTPEETPLTIDLSHLTATDPDNTYPTDFTLSVQTGTNYTHSGNAITPNSNFSGVLMVPVTVNDGTANSPVFNLNITVTPVNDAPVIIAQVPLSTPEATALTILVGNVTVTDPDNTTLTLSVQDGTNYTRSGNTITPSPNFTGTLTVPVIVNDGTTNSAVFNLSVTVVPANDAPVITGQVLLNTLEETTLTIVLSHLTVTDPDNTYPTDFTLSVQNGTNYAHSGNTITPNANFSGVLTVPVTVSDGTASSPVFNLSVTVVPANDAPVILGQAPLIIPEETALTIVLSHLIITDPDNAGPTDFTLTVQNGANYTYSGNTITPNINFNGVLTVPVTVNDGTANSPVFNLNITVTPVNDAPVITAQVPLSTPEATALTILLGNVTVTDPDNTTFTLSVLDGTSYTRSGNTITPNTNFTGTLSVPVTVNDGTANSPVFNLSVAVGSANDAPVITGQVPLSTLEETALTIVLSHLIVTDPDNADPTDFTLTIQNGANYTHSGNTITPNANFSGTLSVPVTVNDGTANSPVFNLNITVTPVNDIPVITAQVPLSTPQATALTIALSHLTVTDPDNATLTLSVQDGTNYIRSGNTIIPNTNFTGTLSVPVTVNDGTASSPVFNLSVTVGLANDAPVITGQVLLSTPEETALTIVLSHLIVTDPDDTYPTGFTLSVQNGTNYTHSGNTITPNANFNGVLTVPVTVNDGTAGSLVFNLNITVTPVNDAPVITAQVPLSTPEATALTILVGNVTVTDPDNTTFTLSVLDGANYTRSGNTITPSQNFIGTLSVPVTVNDGTTNSAVFNLIVTVTPVNGVPVITGQVPLSTAEETALTIVLSHLIVTDPDDTYPTGFTLSVQNGTNYTHSGNTIAPNSNFNGVLTVPISVNDGTANSLVFNLSVTVISENDAPVITGQVPLNTLEETPSTIVLSNLLVTDPDNGPGDFTLTVQTGTNYTLSGNTITPNINFTGILSVPVMVSDGTANSGVYNLSVTVISVNDAPIITAHVPLSTLEETALTIRFFHLTVTDPDNLYPTGFTLIVQNGTNYTLSNNTITPSPNFNGVLTVPVTVNDGVANSAVFNLSVTVTPSLNNPPLIIQLYPNQRVPGSQRSLAVPLDQIFSDDNGIQNLTFTVLNISTPALVSANQIVGMQLTFFLTGKEGITNITLKATDVNNAFVETSFQLEVVPDESPIVGINEIIESSIVLYPNPVEKDFSLKLSVKQHGNWNFTLIDFTGKEIPVGSFELSQGIHVLEFDLSPFCLRQGFYYLSVSNSEMRKNIKVAVR